MGLFYRKEELDSSYSEGMPGTSIFAYLLITEKNSCQAKPDESKDLSTKSIEDHEIPFPWAKLH